MASQQGPPSRPWFRLATMVRPPTPQPDQPPPRPALTIRPAFSQAPPPPQPQPPAAANVVPPSRPMPPSSNPRTPPLMQQSVQATSPSRSTPPSLTATMPPAINRPTSLSPPKTVKTSPNNKPLSHPPSPLALPSPQLKSYYVPEYDQKSVLVQETKQKQPKGLDNGDLRRHMAPDTDHNPTKKPEASKKHLDSEDHVGMRVITIAGENKGAIMELTPFGNKTSHKFGKKDNPTTASSTDGDTNSKANNKNQKSPLIMNSNVQAVNNSILYNCSTTHHDPGIHFSLSTNPTGGRRSLHKDHMHKLND